MTDDSVDLQLPPEQNTNTIQQENAIINSKLPSWKQDSVGWWIEYTDGYYITNSWHQSPNSGLWYYIGVDGYMLTNSITPDGYYVGIDGALIQ